jgi:hypothetical protein
MQASHLITLADQLSSHIGKSDATISNKIAGHARLFKRLREKNGCTLRTADRAMQWFAANWPADLEWPRDIPRPKKREAA